MADIRPFCGVHYNRSLVSDLAAVICPPYDIITPQMQQELHQLDECNFVRLEYDRELPQDTAIDNRYTRSAATLEQWLEQGILEADETPAIYMHDHYFTFQGEEYRRCGIIALVRLEEWDKMVVRPHEGTLTEPKGDRLSLLWALQANTSSILALYEDREQQVSSLLVARGQGEPVITLTDANGERHNIWAITEPEVIDQIRSYVAEQPVYIADGHHRYESALTYQRERSACSATVSGDEGFNFVMMTLVDFADPGLVILPPHRLVRGVPKSGVDGLMAKLKPFFEIEELPLDAPALWQRVDGLLAEEASQVKVLLFGPTRESLFLLKLNDFAAVSQMMPYFHSEMYKRLDVSVVDHVILEEMLGLSPDDGGKFLTYSYDRLDAINRVLDQEYQLAFLLEPIKAEVIKAIADAADRMSKKSTYFYPKIPSGLVFYRMV